MKPCPKKRSSEGDGRGLRSDAVANRQKVLDAASELFCKNGVNTSLEDVAKLAGVGIGTLYRRFPSRAELIVAVYEPAIIAWTDSIEDALTLSDPCEGLTNVLSGLFDLQFSYRGYAEVMTMGFPLSPEFEETRMRGVEGLRVLTARAKRRGCLRKDYSPRDLLIFMMANAGIVEAGGDVARVSSRRLLAYFFRSILVNPDKKLPAAPELDEVIQAMRRLRPLPS
ncbi:MAG: TetR/AcrR family transcriptional regulator [Actinomycetota bacterium]|nr:TetR/AcrR family transcriptional regulator [Actinomycetota bacterium]